MQGLLFDRRFMTLIVVTPSHEPLQNKKIAFTLPLVNYCAVYAQV